MDVKAARKELRICILNQAVLLGGSEKKTRDCGNLKSKVANIQIHAAAKGKPGLADT